MADGLALPKTVVLFGAGASAYSDPQINCPPLGDHLLEALHFQSYVARILLDNPAYRRLFKAKGFEVGMMEAAHDNSLPKNFIAILQRDIARFLSSFDITERSFYSSLLDNVLISPDNIGFVSLNYDILLEQALSERSLGYYCHPEDYKDDALPLMKPHGSSNFLPDMQGITMKGTTVRGLARVLGGPATNIVNSRSDISLWLNDPHNEDMCPVMSYYAKGKAFYCNGDYVDGIRQHYAAMVADAESIVIIGTKYTAEDTHLWQPIMSSQASVYIVDPDIENRKLFQNVFRRRYNYLADTFENCIEPLSDLTNKS